MTSDRILAPKTQPLAWLFGLRSTNEEGFKPRALLVGLACIAVAASIRIALEFWNWGILPFNLTFPAVIIATLVAGAAAGWISLVGCQLLTLFFVLPHWTRDTGAHGQDLANLLLATAGLMLAVWATASYRRLASDMRTSCEHEVEMLSLLIDEIDHRTKNNFQIAASLLSAQAIASNNPGVKEELEIASGRLVSMATVYQNLSARRAGADAVPLLDHLERVGFAIQNGVLKSGVKLQIDGEEVVVAGSVALASGLVVNEWITNAAKYAFPDDIGEIHVHISTMIDNLEIEVRDDGVGVDNAIKGTGSRLLDSLVGALGGRTSVHAADGTRCVLTLPLKA